MGSTRLLTDELGNNTDSYDYEAFGELLNQTGVTENDYLFTGEQFDSGLDNYYLRARYYDPTSARFTQMDSWMGRDAESVTLNKYLYANVDPVNGVDPTGKFTIASAMGSVRIGVFVSNASIASLFSYGKLSGSEDFKCWTKCMEDRTSNMLTSTAIAVGELLTSTYKPHLGFPLNSSSFSSVIRKLSVSTGGALGTKKIANWIKRNPINARISAALGKGANRKFQVTQGMINSVYYAASAYLFYNSIACTFEKQ